MCAPRQQGAQRDTAWQVPGTGDGRRGGGGGWAGFRAWSSQGGALAGAGAGAYLWGLARDNVDTAEVAAEGQGWPQLYPQAWPRPILGAHLAHLFSSGHPGVEVQPGCTWSDGAELPSAPHLARANVTVEKTRGWALGDSVFLQARGSSEQRLSRSPAGSEPSWPQADGLGRAGYRHEVGEADPGGVRRARCPEEPASGTAAPRGQSPSPTAAAGKPEPLGLSPNNWTGENREGSPTAAEPERSAWDLPGAAARRPSSASDRSQETPRVAAR